MRDSPEGSYTAMARPKAVMEKPYSHCSAKEKMKVKARSIVGKTFVGTIIWIVAVAVFNLVIFLIFGDCKFTVSTISISVIALAFKVISFLYIAFLALSDSEVSLADDEGSEDKAEVIQPENEEAQRVVNASHGKDSTSSTGQLSTDDSLSNQSSSNSLGSLLFGFTLLVILGLILCGVGVSNLKHEIGIYNNRVGLKLHGKEAYGVVAEIEKRTRRSSGSKAKYYTVYLHTINYDQYTTVYSRPYTLSVGMRVPVLYSLRDPNNVLVGDKYTDVSEFRQSMGSDLFGFLFGLALYGPITLAGIALLGLILVRGRAVIEEGKSKAIEK